MSEPTSQPKFIGASLMAASQIFQGRGWTTIVAVVAVAGIGLLSWFAWSYMGPALTGGGRYALTPEMLSVPAPPEWIDADVQAEVYKQARLQEISVVDPQAAVKVYNAFAVHPWIAKVNQVSKVAGPKIVVDLEYRRPVAMVEVYDNSQWGLLPIDGHGVVLSPSAFSGKHARSFLRIAVDGAMPIGDVGSNWGDSRVVGGARIALAWGDQWEPLKLYRVSATVETAGGPPVYEITTRDNNRVIWGNAPGQEENGENKPEDKVQLILAEVAARGPLEGRSPPVVIDVRRGDSKRQASAAQTPDATTR